MEGCVHAGSKRWRVSIVPVTEHPAPMYNLGRYIEEVERSIWHLYGVAIQCERRSVVEHKLGGGQIDIFLHLGVLRLNGRRKRYVLDRDRFEAWTSAARLEMLDDV